MLEINNVSVNYGKQKALEDICLMIKEGDFWGLFGADDAGKTSLLHIIMGFRTVYQGAVKILDSNILTAGADLRSQIRFVPDDIIWEELTAEEYLCCARGTSGNYDTELQQQLCEDYEIPVRAPLLSMTYQENKLVQIIAAVCAAPRILILDEPANFLSKNVYRSFLCLLADLHKKGMTILLAAEKYKDVRGFCDHYAYLKEGRIVAAAEVPKRDIRKKAVTVTGQAEETELWKKADTVRLIAEHGNKRIYIYEGDGKELAERIADTECEDWLAEELTLEEELDENYERWE